MIMAEKKDIPKIASIEGITPEDLSASFAGSAPFANKITLNVNSVGARLSFLETHPDLQLPVYRASVFIGHHDLIALRDLLSEQIEKNLVVKIQEQQEASDVEKG